MAVLSGAIGSHCSERRGATAVEFVLFRLAVTMTESRVVINFTEIFRSSDPG